MSESFFDDHVKVIAVDFGKKSPKAAAELLDALDEEMMGDTDCPQGCTVEPDGTCPHGFESAALTAGVI